MRALEAGEAWRRAAAWEARAAPAPLRLPGPTEPRGRLGRGAHPRPQIGRAATPVAPRSDPSSIPPEMLPHLLPQVPHASGAGAPQHGRRRPGSGRGAAPPQAAIQVAPRRRQRGAPASPALHPARAGAARRPGARGTGGRARRHGVRSLQRLRKRAGPQPACGSRSACSAPRARPAGGGPPQPPPPARSVIVGATCGVVHEPRRLKGDH